MTVRAIDAIAARNPAGTSVVKAMVVARAEAHTRTDWVPGSTTILTLPCLDDCILTTRVCVSSPGEQPQICQAQDRMKIFDRKGANQNAEEKTGFGVRCEPPGVRSGTRKIARKEDAGVGTG